MHTQKSCKESARNSCTPFTQIQSLLTFFPSCFVSLFLFLYAYIFPKRWINWRLCPFTQNASGCNSKEQGHSLYIITVQWSKSGNLTLLQSYCLIHSPCSSFVDCSNNVFYGYFSFLVQDPIQNQTLWFSCSISLISFHLEQFLSFSLYLLTLNF